MVSFKAMKIRKKNYEMAILATICGKNCSRKTMINTNIVRYKKLKL